MSYNKIDKSTLYELLDIKIDEEFSEDKCDSFEYSKKYRKYYSNIRSKAKSAVLGIDIYRYSGYSEEQQLLIPILFHLLLRRTVKDIFICEPYLFQKYNEKKFFGRFIDTGDGGYIIFSTPLHALAFAFYFESNIRLFNTNHLYPSLHSLLTKNEPLTLRYALTYGSTYKISWEEEGGNRQNYYGASIITCGRILSKDKLNRCLIDENTYDWFLTEFHGIDNLPFMNLQYIVESKLFSRYAQNMEEENPSLLFPDYDSCYNWDVDIKRLIHSVSIKGLKVMEVQKIGQIKAKLNEYSIYSIFGQFSFRYWKDSSELKYEPFTISLGNTNSSGINDGKE